MRATVPCVLTLALLFALPAHAGDPPKVLLIGDSNIFGVFGKELQKALRERGFAVARKGKPTSGMARPDFYDWMVEAPPLLDKHDPDIVIMMFGGNDGQRLVAYPKTSARTIKWKEDLTWKLEYRARVMRLMELLAGRRRQVFLLSPTNRWGSINRRRMRRVVAVQREAAEAVPRTAWIDVFALSSDERGSYLSHGMSEGRRVRYRHADGIHLNRAGAKDLRGRVIPALMRAGLAKLVPRAAAGESEPRALSP